MKLWMVVTQDEYELPLCVSRYPDVVAEYAGVSVEIVWQCVVQYRRGRLKKTRFRCVEVDDD